MDWKTWVAVGLSIIGLILWQFLYAAKLPPPPIKPPAPIVTQAQPEPTTLPTTPVVPKLPEVEEPQMIAQTSEILSSKDADYVFNNDAGGIEKVILLLHFAENRESVFLNRDRRMPIGAIGMEPGQVVGGFNMAVDRSKEVVVFTKKEADGLEIRKTFSLPSKATHTDRFNVLLNIEFKNTSENPVQRPGYFVSAGTAAPIHIADLPLYTRFDWYHDGKMESIDVNWFSASTIPILGYQTHAAQANYAETRDKISWAAVTSQYFCTILQAKNNQGVSVWARRFEAKKNTNPITYGMQGGLGLSGFQLAAGETKSQQFEIYAGPKEFDTLRALGDGRSDLMSFGWFHLVSEFLLWAMNSLNGVLGNYAAAIIVLTLLIKSALWPIQNKATKSMRRMSLLSPKMTELREKYKDNPQKMNEELMRLYKDYGINPFSGCLPMLIQIPIFFGFYSMLGVAIELRNASFLWINDLSQPDTIAHIYGFPINLLPIIMSISMIWQMALTPKSGDAMQQRILYFMPVIFLAFCYNYASALALYWTTQNIFSIVQLYLTRNQPLPTLEKKSVVAKREAEALKKNKRKG